MFEKGLPGKSPFSSDSAVSTLPLETCETINNSWGYNSSDQNYKSVRDLIHYLVKAAGNNANFLLNVGPRPDGTIQDEFKERLAAMGEWLRTNGGSIYGTRGGPIPPQSWGVSTRTKDLVYLHVLSDTDKVIAVPDFGKVVTSITLMDGAAVQFDTTPLGYIVKMPDKGRDPYDTVLVVK
jgi:alpha-L-fucosidase